MLYLLYVTVALHVRTWNLNPFEFQGFVIKPTDWKPAPTIMGLGHIQDQKVHISSAGLDTAKSVVSSWSWKVFLISKYCVNSWLFWGWIFLVVWVVFLMWTAVFSPTLIQICNCLFDQNCYWLSGGVFQSCTCATICVEAREFHVLRMELSEMQFRRCY